MVQDLLKLNRMAYRSWDVTRQSDGPVDYLK